MLHQEANIPSEQAAQRLADELLQFDGPPEQFLAHLLDAQLRLAPAEAGVILRISETPPAPGDGEPVHPGDRGWGVLAIAPHVNPGDPAPRWLADAIEAARRAAAEGASVTASLMDEDELYGQEPARRIIAIPLASMDGARGVGVYIIQARERAEVAARRERLELTRGLLGLYELRIASNKSIGDVARLRLAMELAGALSGHVKATAACMALCSESASRLRCERVSLGFVRGRTVALAGMSHTEKVNRKMNLVQQLEAVMEECFDQDLETLWPSPPEGAPITRAAEHYAKAHGPLSVCSLPLRRAGDPVGVMTLERAADHPFSREEIESLRLACDLTAPRLLEMRERDRWLGARMAAEVRRGIAVLLGPERTWIKLIAVVVLAAILCLTFINGDYRVETTFVFEAQERRIVPSPIDGYLAAVYVEPGDIVEAGVTRLADLDASELRLRLAATRAEESRYLKEASIARRDREIAKAQIAEAGVDEVRAQIQLLEHQISQSSIIAAISGIIVTGDLRRQLGAPVQKGSLLFEIAPIDALRADLAAPEDQINDIVLGMTGELATASYPSVRIPFVVERINPIAEVIDSRNIFNVRARLLESHEWMRPGMAGVAKVDVDRRPYGWIWSRRLVNWVRMQLWI